MPWDKHQFQREVMPRNRAENAAAERQREQERKDREVRERLAKLEQSRRR